MRSTGGGFYQNYPEDVRAIVNFYGVTDLRAWGRDALFSTWDRQSATVLSLASPVDLVRSNSPPVLTIHGEADTLVSISHALALEAEFQEQGAVHEFITLTGVGHGFPISADVSYGNPDLTDEVVAFLEQHLAGLPGDRDSDGLPDRWEVQYFGAATNANPNAVCSNGINTVREAYVGGFSPVDPSAGFNITGSAGDRFTMHWSAVSGRIYSVYWTTNLLSGFQCLESNIPWTSGTFTNSKTDPCGYFKLKVRLAP